MGAVTTATRCEIPMRSLPDTSHEHHEQIQPHVDRLPELAEMIGRVPPDVFAARFEEECRFLLGQLAPHMEAIEATLYGRLEELMDGRHSMAPMRVEHEQLRALFESLGRYSDIVAQGDLSPTDEIGLRRVLYRLFAMLRVHLAEEELYLGVLDRSLSAEEKDQLARGLDHAVAEPL
jgi:hemerythrin-like domain-containing protein